MWRISEIVGVLSLSTLSNEGGGWERAGSVVEWIVLAIFVIAILYAVVFVTRLILRAGRGAVGLVLVTAALGVAFALLVPPAARAETVGATWRIVQAPLTIGDRWRSLEGSELVGAAAVLLTSALVQGVVLAGLALILTRKGRVAVTAGILGVAIAATTFAAGFAL